MGKEQVLHKQIKVFTQFLMAFYDLYAKKRSAVRNSLTFFRMVFFYREFRWIQYCISQNAYHQCIRELRFILDSIIQAYYVDERHHNSRMSCKLEIVKEVDRWGFGGKLIEQTNLRHKQDLKDLYGELSTYVHSTYRELTSSLPKKANQVADLRFEADNEMKNLCIDLTNQTIDAVFFVTLSLFPAIFGARTKLITNIKPRLTESLKELEYKFTLKTLRETSSSQRAQDSNS